jgi:hypothetical protein
MANPTTNYGFVLPTSSDLVTDLPADFDVALQGVDTRLKALQPGTTLGDLAYSSATANTNTRLAIGTTGQVLTVSGGVPAWQSPAGGGKVLQVVASSAASETSTSSSSPSDIGLSATITPSSTSSKILVLASVTGIKKYTGNGAGANIYLHYSGTGVLFELEGYAGNTDTSTNNNVGGTSTSYLHSPATTSARTYKIQFAARGGINGVKVMDTNCTSTLVLMEIGA